MSPHWHLRSPDFGRTRCGTPSTQAGYQPRWARRVLRRTWIWVTSTQVWLAIANDRQATTTGGFGTTETPAALTRGRGRAVPGFSDWQAVGNNGGSPLATSRALTSRTWRWLERVMVKWVSKQVGSDSCLLPGGRRLVSDFPTKGPCASRPSRPQRDLNFFTDLDVTMRY